ncbi:MAG: hypothetical protein KDB02_09335 [Acidimicrobiales bacterium]|nr:hypothetical protein [Acidimicrobiales bacterium]
MRNRTKISSVAILPTVAVLVAGGLLAGCGGSNSDSSSTTTARTATTAESASQDGRRLDDPSPIGTFAVARVEVTFVDDSRPTKAHGGQPEKPQRTLPTVVWYPTAGDATGKVADGGPMIDGGKAPLIVFSHGSTRNADDYASTLVAWASAGYVVAGPNYPLSTTGVPGGTDYGGAPEQAVDVAFVIDRMLAGEAGDEKAPWSGRIDDARIGLGGQSFGAITTLTAVADPCCTDDRIAAITEFAGFGGGSEKTPADATGAPPALFVHGNADPTVPYDAGRGSFDHYPGDAWFLTLVGTGHDDGYFGGLDEPLDELVTRATAAFYDAQLKGDDQGMDRLRELVSKAGPKVATLEPRS